MFIQFPKPIDFEEAQECQEYVYPMDDEAIEPHELTNLLNRYFNVECFTQRGSFRNQGCIAIKWPTDRIQRKRIKFTLQAGLEVKNEKAGD